MKLLLHACCAPCSVYCIKQLRKENIEPVLYWYNPNIHPFKEYEKRRDTLLEYASSIGVEAIIDDTYGLDEFCKNTANNLENRCTSYCYPVRLRKTFEYAKENGFDAVSTTLLYSIYQNHDFIKSYCEKLSEEFGVVFLYRDFRFGFWEGHDEAIKAGLYMQKYCGCVFSEEDRYVKKIKTKPFLPEGFEFRKK
ncbi:MAG: epoxyqueuosine reductase QueH [Clostridiales bacterium]|nr:epoxyqueuosine reductase QueH [Clostridiales bacterium]